jgi:2,4-dienoyl-CoA reductase-like NADH-dependent reductase (Old Yellow Enzyme family)
MQSEPPLFQPCDLGGLRLVNRIVMAPLTRAWATAGTDAANEPMVETYRHR